MSSFFILCSIFVIFLYKLNFMKALKYILYTLLGIIALLLVVAAVLPKDFHAEGVTEINRPVDEVYAYVKQLKTQEQYSVWHRMAQDIQSEYKGEDGTVGSEVVWKSDDVGDGKQIIKSLEENKKVVIDLYLMEGAPPSAYVFQTDAVDDHKTKVTVSISGSVDYPWNIFSLFAGLDSKFQETADNLKVVLEK